jgi:hypothetical protein
MYYNGAGQTFTVALPVRQTLVSDAVINKANQMYGPTLYDVTAVKGSNGQDIYLVRTIENGQIVSQWMGEDGTKVIDVYRTESTDAMNNMNGNSNTNSSMNNSSMNNSQTNTNTDQSVNSNTTNTTDNSSDMSNSNTNTTDSGTTSGTGKDKLKIKTKTSDGKIHKTKMVNGKVTTKGDQ